jgi:arsenite methyltransferase
MKEQADVIRHEVSETYAGIVKKPTGNACCGRTPPQKGIVAKLGGYSSEELATLPPESVANSFGCGNPVALSGLKPGDVGPKGYVIGVDMTDAMIAKANENIRAGNFTNVEVRKGIIENLPVESNSVDWVISNCVINLSPEKNKVFSEIARVLKPGGQMLVSDIVAQNLPDEVRNFTKLYSSCISGAISEDEYITGLRDAGLDNVEVRDRLIYDADQLDGIVRSDLLAFPGIAERKEELSANARMLAGKIWSAKVYARKRT